MDFKISNYPKLKEAILQSNLVVFVGAGLTMNFINTQNKPIGNWNNLVREILENFKTENNISETLINLIGKFQPIQILDLIEKSKDYNKKDIYSFIKDFLELSENNNFLLHQKIAKLSNTIITTNYDTAFEDSNKNLKSRVAYSGKNFELTSIKDNKPILFKLHGCYTDAGSMVLFPTDYYKLYDTNGEASHSIKALENLIYNKNILFLGCGMGDFQINNIFKSIEKLQANFNQDHFIISKTNIDSSLGFLTHIPIKDHNEIETIIESLLSIKEITSESHIKELLKPGMENLLSKKENKLSDYPKPSILFTGREQQIIELEDKFKTFRIIAIEGLGGIGKTQFVSKFIDEKILDKSRVVWLNGSAQSNFDVFIENCGYGDILIGKEKTDHTLYASFKDLIENDNRIIFWDNYNDYEDKSFANFLSFANSYFQKATIILITKVDPQIENITSLPIIKLDGLQEDAIKYAEKIKISNSKYSHFANNDLERICSAFEGHPLAIEFSMLLMGYGKSVDDILSHLPEFSSIRKVEEFSKRLFLDIYNHPITTDEERECFLKSSVFKGKMKEEEIKFLYKGNEVFHLLVGLMDKLLVTFKDGLYEIHPLVRSFTYEMLCDKKVVHKDAAEYFLLQRNLQFNSSLEEKIFYHLSEAEEWEKIGETIESIGIYFVQNGQLSMISDFFSENGFS